MNENSDRWTPLMSDDQFVSPLQRMMEATPDATMRSPIVAFSPSDPSLGLSSPRMISVLKNRHGPHSRQHFNSSPAQHVSEPKLAHATRTTLMGLIGGLEGGLSNEGSSSSSKSRKSSNSQGGGWKPSGIQQQQQQLPVKLQEQQE
eukprot:CAMPEP_0185763362 /NCGR_PEP_ID=MMETSP1174-20130828/22301_1 /TAXON_ID=35687 /ORGANISM="Dictyocha speculum, Strain CCMP1381" /LENGTH=145 /DNA_ID=CAMNT_0028445447 /DNA_START=135 /DNA_END=572 /DNA_ORIENTATION=+